MIQIVKSCVSPRFLMLRVNCGKACLGKKTGFFLTFSQNLKMLRSVAFVFCLDDNSRFVIQKLRLNPQKLF